MIDNLEDVRYTIEDGVAWITIDRPDRYNAFRSQTINEIITCFNAAWVDSTVGVVVLTGSGDKAFCAGGDLKQRAASGDYGPSSTGKFEMATLHRLIRDIPKPVIAAVNGAAIGGGHVLHVLCDMSIAAETATFGQSGPKVGSFDGGFGGGYLSRVIGEKRAREMWFMCEVYDAQTALSWGLVNKVVPLDQLHDEVQAWGQRLLQRSPTALRLMKHCLNLDTDGLPITMAYDSLELLKQTDESREGSRAFAEKRSPDFSAFR